MVGSAGGSKEERDLRRSKRTRERRLTVTIYKNATQGSRARVREGESREYVIIQ